MRMRKKKHLGERLDLCRNLTVMNIEDRNEQTSTLQKEYIDFEKIFGNNNPIYLEIGCGKGKFCTTAARENPDINFVAVERTANVMVSACEQGEGISNLHFILGGAEYLPKFLKPDSISRLYLNFSCPFPKKKYAAHRLTAGRFLRIYKAFLKPDAEIHQKTDNMHFFEFSIEQFSENGFALKNISLDLHKSDFEGNIETEYEQLFSSMGMPIYRLEAYMKK